LDKNIFPLATNITFGDYYNRSLDKNIFPLATNITFGDYYDKPLDNDIFPLATRMIFGYNYDLPIIKVLDQITVFGIYIKKNPDIVIIKKLIQDNMQYKLRYIYDIGYVYQNNYEYYKNTMATLLLIRNNILEYDNEYSNISNLPNELIQNICKFIL